ncbi:hypothetical protein HDU76_000527, partial [Blyttiomyces sp. JEL0837]
MARPKRSASSSVNNNNNNMVVQTTPPTKPHNFYPRNHNRRAKGLEIAIDLEWYDQKPGDYILEIGLAIQPYDR